MTKYIPIERGRLYYIAAWPPTSCRTSSLHTLNDCIMREVPSRHVIVGCKVEVGTITKGEGGGVCS